MLKHRIAALEKIVKFKPNNGCAIISYEDNPITDRERKQVTDKGILVIDVTWH